MSPRHIKIPSARSKPASSSEKKGPQTPTSAALARRRLQALPRQKDLLREMLRLTREVDATFIGRSREKRRAQRMERKDAMSFI